MVGPNRLKGPAVLFQPSTPRAPLATDRPDIRGAAYLSPRSASRQSFWLERAGCSRSDDAGGVQQGVRRAGSRACPSSVLVNIAPCSTGCSPLRICWICSPHPFSDPSSPEYTTPSFRLFYQTSPSLAVISDFGGRPPRLPLAMLRGTPSAPCLRSAGPYQEPLMCSGRRPPWRPRATPSEGGTAAAASRPGVPLSRGGPPVGRRNIPILLASQARSINDDHKPKAPESEGFDLT